MRIRTLVPALACLAAAPAFMFAADSAPVKLDGFVDTIYGWSDNKSQDATGDRVGSGFQYFAKLGAELTISDKIGGQIDITSHSYADSGFNTTDTNANNVSVPGNGVWLRQAYGTWKMTPDVTFKSGEFINCIGWTAPYAPGLYRINAGPITSLYGDASTVGADVVWSKSGSPVNFEAALTNGFFSEGHGEVAQPTGSNYGYALFLDGTYALPDKKGNVDAEFVYDTEAGGITDGSNDRGGAGYHLGLNATLTPNDAVTVGLEGIYQKIGTPDGAAATESDQKNVGLTALGNYKIPHNAWNASVTGQVSYVKKTNVLLVDGDTSKTTEVAVAVLTTPAGTDKFGVNGEISYAKVDTDAGTSSTAAKVWTISLEALYIIP